MSPILIVDPVARLFWLPSRGEPESLAFFLKGEKGVIPNLTASDLVEIDKLVQGTLFEATSNAVQTLIDRGVVYFSEHYNQYDFNDRYSRQVISYSNFTNFDNALKAHNKISQIKTLIVGVGGVGCNVIKELMGMGVRQFILVDQDVVEVSNLNRQILFTINDVGLPKVEAAKKNIISILGNEAVVECLRLDFLSWNPMSDEVEQVDLAVISSDSNQPSIRRKAANLFYKKKTSYAFLSYSSIYANVGPLVFDKESGCGCCIFNEIDVAENIELVTGARLLNIAPSSLSINSLVASHFSLAFLQWVVGVRKGSGLIRININNNSVESTDIRRLDSCNICGKR